MTRAVESVRIYIMSQITGPGYRVKMVDDVDDDKEDRGVHITAGGDVMGGVVSGSGNVFRKNVVQGSGTLAIDEGQLAALPPEYADGLRQFTRRVNEQLQANRIDQRKVEDMDRELDEFVRDVGSIKPNADVGVLRQK